jgi:dimethylargininase
MLTAITRAVSRTLAECQLEHFSREPIDVEKATAQHRAYQACLAELGARVIALPAAEECPDGVFVEDPAMVLDEIAIVTRMGNVTRRAESESLAQAVAQYRDMTRMVEPGTLEGGDVMRIGKTLYVGLSRRTNREGISQLAGIVEPYGYRVVAVEVRGCLHLKSACCFAGDGTILANRGWIDAAHFAEFKILDLPSEESRSANVLRVGETVIVPAAFPKTGETLDRAGFKTLLIDTSELLKAEAGVTCMSLLFDA